MVNFKSFNLSFRMLQGLHVILEPNCQTLKFPELAAATDPKDQHFTLAPGVWELAEKFTIFHVKSNYSVQHGDDWGSSTFRENWLMIFERATDEAKTKLMIKAHRRELIGFSIVDSRYIRRLAFHIAELKCDENHQTTFWALSLCDIGMSDCTGNVKDD